MTNLTKETKVEPIENKLRRGKYKVMERDEK